MTSEAMGLIENFSGNGIRHDILGGCAADEHEKDCQECEAPDKRSPDFLQELSLGEEVFIGTATAFIIATGA